jgi:hypothetical protein
MAESYFLPPVTKRVPPRERTPEVRSNAYRHFFWYRKGVEVEIPEHSGVKWQGGRWHGPLTAQQITDITAAGYAARIRTVNNLIELPADID